MTTVGIKNVDDRLYRRVKALAALRGRNVGEVLNEALAIWLSVASDAENAERWKALAEQSRPENALYKEREAEMVADHPGMFVGIADGKVLGFYETEDEACAAAGSTGAKSGIVTKLERREPRTVELGWSLLEQLR